MKALKLVALLALAVTFSQCKSPTQVMQSSTPSLMEVHTILDSSSSWEPLHGSCPRQYRSRRILRRMN